MSRPFDITKYIAENLPIYGACDIKVLSSDVFTGKVSCRPNPLNQNHFDSAHAGVQWMMTEMIGGIIFIKNFDIANYLVVIKRVETDFIKPAYGEILAEGAITTQQLAEISNDLASNHKATFELVVRLLSTQGEELVRTVATYHARSMQ